MKSFSYGAFLKLFVKHTIHVFRMCKFHFVDNCHVMAVHFMEN